MSRLRVGPVTQAIARSATALLRTVGLHGLKYAIDAMLCVMALVHPGRATILTFDTGGIQTLTVGHLRVITEKICHGSAPGFTSWASQPRPGGRT
ncbi:hypothetical protein [Streptomyces alboflavus]|uniref:hypothetical protein n=1 Tax=Streptomyces alboflavus TaxID=67267 RepID=UPI0036C932DB